MTRQTTSIDVAVGQRIRICRTIKGMSMADLGDLLGVAWQQIQKYETGTNRISAARLWQIAEIFGRPVAWFFQDLETEDKKEAEALVEDEVREILSQLDAKTKDTVVSLLKSMAVSVEKDETKS